jgi:5-methylcytosine-specific restriction protein B
MSLFWMKPKAYLSLDKNTRAYFEKQGIVCESKTAAGYQSWMEKVVAEAGEDFPQISADAYKAFGGAEASNPDTPGDEAYELSDAPNPAAVKQVAYWWLNANPDIWDFRKAPVGSIQTYTSRNQNGKKRRIYEHFLAVKAGDLMLGYITTPDKEVVGLCEITKPLHKTDEGEVFEFKKVEQFKSPATWKELQSQPALAHCEPLHNNQGSLFALTKSEYDAIRELIDAHDSEEASSTPQRFSVSDALDGLFMGKDQFDAMLARLRRKKALVLQGPPGVGKTFVAHRLAYALMQMKDKKRVTMVQFHPSYSYEDFIQGYRPTPNGSLERRNAVFYEFARQARNNPTQDWVFIIDEINRGNLAKIFGELLMLLEADKRGPTTQVSLTYSENGETFYLPDNLFVIGTMNTADRSLAMVDYALRRRFAFQTLSPAVDSPEFATWFLQKGASNQLLGKIVDRIGKLNDIIDKERDLGERFRIGHSFFCPGNNDKIDDAWYNEIITGEIAPLLEEYFDAPKRVKQMVDDLLA